MPRRRAPLVGAVQGAILLTGWALQSLPAAPRRAVRQDPVQGAALPCSQLVACGSRCQNQNEVWQRENAGRPAAAGVRLIEMSHKDLEIAALITGLQGRDWPAHYLGFFACFNRGLFYEAHDVLEALWLPSRRGPDDLFYKGLIQLAGAFVHFQKERLRPAGALLRLARGNLADYPPRHQGVEVASILRLINVWLARLPSDPDGPNPFLDCPPPRLNPPTRRREGRKVF